MSASILAALSSSNGNGNAANTTNGNNSTGNTNSNREFVEGWTLAQTLGEGAYGE